MPEKTDNRTIGGRFEQELAQKLSDAGFWVHVLQQNKAGQPADIIASKGSYTTLIDAKVVSGNNGFPLYRVEDNQRSAMTLFEKRTGQSCWFAIKLPNEEIYMVRSKQLFNMIDFGCKSLSEKKIREDFSPYDKWLTFAEVMSGTP